MQLKSCWHSWESVTAIQFRNNSSFSVPWGLRQRVVVWPENLEILNSGFSSDFYCDLCWRSNNVLEIITKGPEKERNVGDQMWLHKLPALSERESISRDVSGPNIGQGKSTERGGWRRMSCSTLAALQCFGTGTTPGALNSERQCHREPAATLLPRKCSSLTSLCSLSAELQKPTVKMSKSKLHWKHRAVGSMLVSTPQSMRSIPGWVSDPMCWKRKWFIGLLVLELL